MDMTDQERNETPVATFNHQDPYEVPLLDETPAPAETPPAEAETAAPVAENKSSVPTDAGDETIPPIIPVEMKESLTDYIDEDLAASVKTLVEKVNSLESALQQERRKAKEVIRENETSGRFSGLWDTESGKFSEVLEAGYKASGAAVPELTDLFKRAVTSEFGTSMVEAREKQINDQVSRRQSQFVSRANSGAQASERPEDRAARAVARMMADRGIR